MADGNASNGRHFMSTAPEPAPAPRRSRLRDFLEFVIILAIAFGLVFGLKTFVVEPYKIPSGSMEPTIATGDYILAEKFDLNVHAGDIVTFTDPTDPSRTLVKRIIATGGQTVDLRDGYVYVDGVRLEEPYVHGKASEPLARTAAGANVSFPYTVSNGCIWVMGDNRTNSSDSRYFGEVRVSSVTGKGFFTYWPLDHAGTLE